MHSNRIILWNIPRIEKLTDTVYGDAVYGDVLDGHVLNGRVLDGHVTGVRGLTFSPDGRTLVSCGDNRVKLWNVETAEELFTLHQAKGETAWPMFSADGTCLVTATSVPSLHLWNAPSWDEIAAVETANLKGQSGRTLAPRSE